MIKQASSLILISLLFINCAKNSQPKANNNKHLTKLGNDDFSLVKFGCKHADSKQQRVNDFYRKYATEVMYEKSYEASILLDYAKFYPNSYLYIKKAFDKHSEMQYGIFSIFDSTQKQKYMQENKKYIYALFDATKTKQQIKKTFNRWLNYKRTLFNDENGLLLSNKQMRAKKRIIDRKKRALARATNPKEIDSLKTDIKNFERSLSSDKYEYSQRFFINYRKISSILQEDELYIDFAKVGKFYYVFTLNKRQNISFKKMDSQEIDLTIQQIRKEVEKINNPQKYPHSFPDIALAKKQYGKLYDLTIGELDIKGKNSLVISPDGLLNLIPFEALYHHQYLIQKLTIRYVPSGKELVKLHNNKDSSTGEIVVFANPNFETVQQGSKKRRGSVVELLTPTFTKLDGSKREAKKIKSLFPNSILFLEKSASERNLLYTHTPKILHLSTHGFFLKDKHILNPMRKSGIVLSGANNSIREKKSNGIITALELAGLNLKGTELVVLSACETGVGEIEEAQGVSGINKAFMSAGAKQIIMSLWSVSDRATAQLMEKFYENLQQKKIYSEALREAKIWMIENKNSHPYFWSGFVGSGRD